MTYNDKFMRIIYLSVLQFTVLILIHCLAYSDNLLQSYDMDCDRDNTCYLKMFYMNP